MREREEYGLPPVDVRSAKSRMERCASSGAASSARRSRQFRKLGIDVMKERRLTARTKSR